MSTRKSGKVNRQILKKPSFDPSLKGTIKVKKLNLTWVMETSTSYSISKNNKKNALTLLKARNQESKTRKMKN